MEPPEVPPLAAVPSPVSFVPAILPPQEHVMRTNAIPVAVFMETTLKATSHGATSCFRKLVTKRDTSTSTARADFSLFI
jgi:hypothetical protein